MPEKMPEYDGVDWIPTGETCPKCGEPLYFGLLREFKDYAMPCACSCVKAEADKKAEEDYIYGLEIIRQRERELSGLRGKWLNARFASFAPAPGQHAAALICQQYAAGFTSETKTGLLLTGGFGSGKTFLAAMVANAILDARRPKKEAVMRAARYGQWQSEYTPVLFVNVMDILGRIKASYDHGDSTEDAIDRLIAAQLLIIDDLGAERKTDWTVERFYEIIDGRYTLSRPVLITTNLKPDKLTAAVGERTADRLREMCSVVELGGKSLRRNESEGKDGNTDE